jgi:hypothetical protein
MISAAAPPPSLSATPWPGFSRPALKTPDLGSNSISKVTAAVAEASDPA